MKRNTRLLLAGLTLSLALAFFLSPFASSLPDGLEKVIERLVPAGRVREAKPPRFTPLPDYGVPGVKDERLSTGIAGAIGTIAVFVAIFFLGRALVRKGASGARREGD